jgi:hypothetical protein
MILLTLYLDSFLGGRSKLSGIENQLKEINKHLDFTYLSLFLIGLGIFIGWLIWG